MPLGGFPILFSLLLDSSVPKGLREVVLLEGRSPSCPACAVLDERTTLGWGLQGHPSDGGGSWGPCQVPQGLDARGLTPRDTHIGLGGLGCLLLPLGTLRLRPYTCRGQLVLAGGQDRSFWAEAPQCFRVVSIPPDLLMGDALGRAGPSQNPDLPSPGPTQSPAWLCFRILWNDGPQAPGTWLGDQQRFPGSCWKVCVHLQPALPWGEGGTAGSGPRHHPRTSSKALLSCWLSPCGPPEGPETHPG